MLCFLISMYSIHVSRLVLSFIQGIQRRGQHIKEELVGKLYIMFQFSNIEQDGC